MAYQESAGNGQLDKNQVGCFIIFQVATHIALVYYRRASSSATTAASQIPSLPKLISKRFLRFLTRFAALHNILQVIVILIFIFILLDY